MYHANLLVLRLVLYCWSSALERQLARGLPTVESELWGDERDKALVVLVPSDDLWLDGAYLSVIGGQRVHDWQQLHTRKPDQKLIEAVRESRDDLLRWQEPWLRWLTFHHLDVRTKVGPDHAVTRRLAVLAANATILYTAERSVCHDSQWISTFHGTQGSVDLTLPPATAELSARARAGVPEFVRLGRWTYHSAWSKDRLPIVQMVVAQALQSIEPPDRYETLLQQSHPIRRSADWHWKAFVQGKVEAYMTQVRALEDYVATRMQTFGDQVTAIVKTLVDTTLVAVAAVIGAAIAALTKDKFDPILFAIIMGVYSIYALIFPLGFNMVEQYRRFKFLDGDFEHHTKRFEARLGSQRTREILGNRRAIYQSRFKGWFRSAVSAYLLLLAASVGAAYLAIAGVLIIPTQGIGAGTAATQASPTTQVTPPAPTATPVAPTATVP